jgi:hypothetical protein
MAKFAGWNAKEASWWDGEGNKDAKPGAEKKDTMRRTSFEKRVSDSRAEGAASKDDRWADREFFTKKYAGDKAARTYNWPDRDKTAHTSESRMVKSARWEDDRWGEASKAARESGAANRNDGKEYTSAADSFDAADHRAPTFANRPAEKAFEHDEPKTIRDVGRERAEADKQDSGLSIRDIRKLLNKD